MWPGSEGLHVLQGRLEDSHIHDEIGLRHYYSEWSKRLGRSASDPYGENAAATEPRAHAPTPLRAGAVG
jgi:methanesulfonate monooxygenase subunit alpha